MDFLTQYENNKVKKSLFSEYEKIMEKHVETYQKVFSNTSDDKIEPTLKNIEKVVEHLKKKILDEDIAIDPFFDEELLKHLDLSLIHI